MYSTEYVPVLVVQAEGCYLWSGLQVVRRIESKGKGLLQKQKAQLDFFTARRKTPALVRTKSGLNDEHANFQERQEQMREEARRKMRR